MTGLIVYELTKRSFQGETTSRHFISHTSRCNYTIPELGISIQCGDNRFFSRLSRFANVGRRKCSMEFNFAHRTEIYKFIVLESIRLSSLYDELCRLHICVIQNASKTIGRILHEHAQNKIRKMAEH